MGFFLKNTGTDTLFVVSYTFQNSLEFTVAGPTQYLLYPDSSQFYSVTFSPKSHQTIHTTSIGFLFGDSSADTLYCFGYDHLPIHDTLSIRRDYLTYAGSDITVSQVLTSSLAGALDSVRIFTEVVMFDPTILNIVKAYNGTNTPAPDWTINTVTTVPGVVSVTATTVGYALQGPGEILRMEFYVLDTTHTFQSSEVWDSAALFQANPLEPIFSTDTGLVRVIDSCTVMMTSGAKPTDAIEQNFPNPASGWTTIPYSIGEGVQSDYSSQQSAFPVRILLYDAVGNLVRTLVDADVQTGWHELETDVSGLSTGTYWYEFRTANTRELKPLVVAR